MISQLLIMALNYVSINFTNFIINNFDLNIYNKLTLNFVLILTWTDWYLILYLTFQVIKKQVNERIFLLSIFNRNLEIKLKSKLFKK